MRSKQAKQLKKVAFELSQGDVSKALAMYEHLKKTTRIINGKATVVRSGS